MTYTPKDNLELAEHWAMCQLSLALLGPWPKGYSAEYRAFRELTDTLERVCAGVCK